MTPIAIVHENLALEGRKRVGFGKFRHCSFEHVYMTHPQYCRWCLTLEARTFLMHDFQAYVRKMNAF
jgi:hypothetical protein